MTRIIKSISVCFSFFAVLALYAHMVIPHDHHLAESDACLEDTCPASDNSTNHDRGFPFHCHAFNDLTSEKALTYNIIKNVRCLYLVAFFKFDSSLTYEQSFLIRFFDICKLPVNSGILDLAALRAPPSLS